MQVSEVYENLLNRVISLSIALEHECDARRAAESKTSDQSMNSRLVVELVAYMATDKKIDAIKAYRALTGYGLKESKDAVESVMERERVA